MPRAKSYTGDTINFKQIAGKWHSCLGPVLAVHAVLEYTDLTRDTRTSKDSSPVRQPPRAKTPLKVRFYFAYRLLINKFIRLTSVPLNQIYWLTSKPLTMGLKRRGSTAHVLRLLCVACGC